MLDRFSDVLYVADEFFRIPMNTLSDTTDSTEPQRRLPRILVVDDERRIADTLSEILELAGFHVMVAYDGWEALERAAQFHPDYLLSDVLMPHMNGVELAIAIRKICPAAKILLFSGQAGIAEILREGQKRGFDFELVAKPIHPRNLIERLKEQ
jgi:CheY-like chemotaxis protein